MKIDLHLEGNGQSYFTRTGPTYVTITEKNVVSLSASFHPFSLKDSVLVL